MNDRTIFRVMDKETTDTIHPDERKSAYLLPRRIVWKQGKISNEEVLLKERESQISLAAWDDCVMDSTDGQASLLLDFGYEIHGGIRILAWKDSTDRGGEGPDPVRGIRNGGHERARRGRQCHQRSCEKGHPYGNRDDEHEPDWGNGLPFRAN